MRQGDGEMEGETERRKERKTEFKFQKLPYFFFLEPIRASRILDFNGFNKKTV